MSPWGLGVRPFLRFMPPEVSSRFDVPIPRQMRTTHTRQSLTIPEFPIPLESPMRSEGVLEPPTAADLGPSVRAGDNTTSHRRRRQQQHHVGRGWCESETTGDVVVGTLAPHRAYVRLRQRVGQLTPPALAGLRGLFGVGWIPCGRLRVGQCWTLMGRVAAELDGILLLRRFSRRKARWSRPARRCRRWQRSRPARGRQSCPGPFEA